MAVAACPRCGFETGADVCPLCGSRMTGAGEGSGSGRSGPAGTANRADRPAARVAWEDPDATFPLDAWTTWRESLLEPASFFRRVDPAAPLSRPVLYLLLVTVVGAFFHLVWQAFLYVPMMGDAAPYGGGLHLIQFFAAPFSALFVLAVQALVLHLFVLVLAPEHRGIGSTARVVCYASGPAVLLAVPFVGGLAGWIWSVVLQVVGIREVHRTTTGRAVVVALGPPALVLLAGLFLAILVAVTVGQGEFAASPSLPVPLP